jgi:hypothetical protein
VGTEEDLFYGFVKSERLEKLEGREAPFLYFKQVPVGTYYPRHADIIAMNADDTSSGEIEELEKSEVWRKSSVWSPKFSKIIAGKSVWVLEIKTDLSTAPLEYEALGQILWYRHFFPKTYPSTSVRGVAIICRDATFDFREICSTYDVKLF